jgi:putative DNA primase/helicase
VLPFLYGTGSNGKTTLITTVMSVLGDYGQQAAPDLLLAKQGAHPTELADLFGARFVASVEVEDGRRFAESLVKQLTGGDKIRARRMREDFWEFDATHKVFLAANHKPVVRGTDHGIWRRIKLIPFTIKIPDAQQDKSLPKKLKAELPGILAWAVRGCSDWQREGLGEPEEVTSATEEYRSEMDVLANFIEDRCVEHEDAHAAAAQLWKAWKSWADISGEKIGTQKAFGARLTERGFESFKYSGGKHKDRRGWAGIGLQTGDDPDPERDDSSDEERTIDRPLADDPPLNRPLQKKRGICRRTVKG